MSIANSTELFSLKKTINTSAEAVESLVKSVKDKSRQALAEALICGKALLRAKEILKFGQFEKWRSENCKKISEQTARRYMQLAKGSLVSDQLATGIGLKQAYVSLGILKEDDAPTGGTLNNTVGDASLAGTTQMKASKASVTPMANQHARANGKHVITTITPEISSEDHLSRLKFLTGQLVGELNSKITIKGITLTKLEAIALTPLAEWFKVQAKKN